MAMATDFSTRFATAWVPVQETASELRHEFTALETLVQEAFADVDHLRIELEAKADELDEARRQLAERGRQLAEHRKDSTHLTHQLEQQETHLRETLAELRELRQQFALEQEAARQRQAQENDAALQRAAQLEAECHNLQTQLQLAQAAASAEGDSTPLAALLQEIAALRNQVLETRTDLSAAIDRATPAPAEQPSEDLALVELRALREQLTAEHEAARQRHTQEQETLAQRAAQFEFERDELRRQLQAQLELAQAAVVADDEAPLAALLQEVTALRDHVLETRTDLSAAIERQASERSAIVPAIVASDSGVESAAAEQLAQFAQEKAELENELELVRTRAAELHETVAEQKNQLREERSITATELKELRRLVEQQADLLAQREPHENVRDSIPAPRISISARPPAPQISNTVPASAIANSAGANSAANGAGAPSSVAANEAEPVDPVVDSVMAQFAKLQKDVAQRRKKK